MNALIKAPQPTDALIPATMNDAIRLAELMATGKLMPPHLRTPGDCLMVIEQAMRWRMSPFAVAQCTGLIHGKLMFEGKLVAAAVETSGALTGLIDYEFSGNGETRAVTVRATRKGETEAREITVELKDAKTDNGIWKKQPDQQLCYFGVRAWARRWTPAVMLGVYTPEEFSGTTIEGTPIAPSPVPAQRKAPQSRREEITNSTQRTGDEVNDSIPALDNEKPFDPTKPEYPWATNQGGKIYDTGSAWIEAITGKPRGLIARMVAADALDKLREAREMNRGVFDQIRDFDPLAVAEVETAIAAALGEEPSGYAEGAGA